MLAFDPPAGFRDVSRYTFAGPGRRVTVRSSSEIGTETDLLQVAKDYESLQSRMLGATTVDAGVQKRTDDVPYVVVTATGPNKADGPYQAESPAVDRSGFLLFKNGVCVHLSLSAKVDDAGAAAEFQQLLASIQPAVATTTRGPTALASTGGEVRQAGPVSIDLPAAYRDTTVLTYKDPTSNSRLTVHVAQTAALAAPTAPSPPTKPGLFSGIETGVDNHGQPFAFETGQDPWGDRLRRLQAAPGIVSAVTGPAAALPGAPPVASTTNLVRQVGGHEVVVRVHTPKPDPSAQKLAEDVLQSVRIIP